MLSIVRHYALGGFLTGDPAPLWLAATALLVYVPAIWWGLPVATNPALISGWDVDGITGIATLAEFNNLLISASPDWYVAYPLFHYFLLGALYTPYLAFLWLTGGLSEPTAMYPYGLEDPVISIAVLAVIGRTLTLSMAVGTVLAAYWAAAIVWNKRTGAVAALFVMLNLPMVYRARTGNLDVPVLFWTALGVVVLALISKYGLSVQRATMIGVFSALATATKDQAYGGWVVAILALLFIDWRGLVPAGEESRGRWRAPAALVLSGLVVYSVAGGIFLHPDRYLAHMDFILTYEEARFEFEETGLERGQDLAGFALLARDVAWTTIGVIGIPGAALALAGCWLGRRTQFIWLLAAMGVGYLLLVLVPIAHMQLRYSLLLSYLLAFPAAWWVCSAWEQRPPYRLLARAGGVLAVAWLLWGAYDLTYQMLFDARYDAAHWLSDNLTPGQRVGFFGDVGQLPAVPNGVAVERFEGGEMAAAELRSAGVDVVLLIPDYTTPAGGQRSLFLPNDDYENLVGGAFPYELERHYQTPSWRERYPFVNPPVRMFVRAGAVNVNPEEVSGRIE